MASLMKGHCWNERKDKLRRDKSPVVTYPLYAEIKYDEIRCNVLVSSTVIGQPIVEFLSYAGKPLANMEQFKQQFIELMKTTGHHEFDCGFLVNNNFNASYRWVRSTNGLPTDLVDAETSFILFDLPTVHLPYNARREVVREVALIGGLLTAGYWVCHSEAEVDECFVKVREAGLEGLMLKSFPHMYEPGKRTDGWLKLKPSNDEAGVIIGATEAVSLDGVPLGRIGSITVRVADGSVASPSGIPHDLGRDMYENPHKYSPSTVEFKYMERDRQGGYRHPVFVRFREEVA